MEEKSTATLERIQQAAMEEFTEKGFQGASLRQIVKQAGVTTGAFYGYFSSKEALFASIVEPRNSRNTWDWSPANASIGWWTTSATTESR